MNSHHSTFSWVFRTASILLIFLQAGYSVAGDRFLVVNVSHYDPKADVASPDDPIKTDVDFSTFDAAFLKSQGVGALIARSTMGSGENLYSNYKGKKNKLNIVDTDDRFRAFIKSADNANLRLGAYHLLRPNEDPTKQARFFVSTVKSCWASEKLKNSHFLFVLDAGYSSVPGRVAEADGKPPTRSRVNEKEVVEFIIEFHRITGTYPVYYPEGGKSFKEIRSWTKATKQLLDKCPLWIAHYSDIDPFKGRTVEPWKKWALHQYASPLFREKNKKYYYQSHHGAKLICRANKIIPLELSSWGDSIPDPANFWRDHSYDVSKHKE